MANFLAQFQSIKNSSNHLIIAVEDVSDLWPSVREGFENCLPFKKACLNNKTRNPSYIEKLPAEFILTTDARLRSRFPQEQSLFWFREPYTTIILVTCEDLDEFKTILKPRLKLILQNDEREWFIVFVSKAHPNNDQATKLARRIYAKLEVDFSSKRRERCCKLDLHVLDSNFWEEFESRLVESIKTTLDRRVQFYEDEIRKLSEVRLTPVWSFCTFFILKESLAFMFEMSHLHEDALREYDELELCYLENVNSQAVRHKDFGGLDHGDDQAAFLNPGNKPLTQIVLDDSFREFEFRQYLFACQAKLLFKLKRLVEVVSRGYSFVISFSKTLALHENSLPFCMREVWIITACLALISTTTSCHGNELLAPAIDKDFCRLLGDLYSLARVKFMRLAYLIGYESEIERSPLNREAGKCTLVMWQVFLGQCKSGPCEAHFNSFFYCPADTAMSPVAALSMLPWPKPGVWPSVPTDASSSVMAKEKMIIQARSGVKHINIQRKPLPLEPCLLLREANRRRASLSAGNVNELFDGRKSVFDGSGLGGSSKLPSDKVHGGTMSRINSGPGNLESSTLQLDQPMRLSEIHVAAEKALQHTISDSDLLKSLSCIEEYEKRYLQLTKGAAENYHCSWWRRHGVVFDGELATVCFKHGNFDLAAKSYEKVCALYAGEGWQDLLAEVLPNLAECQKTLNDTAGYLSSCVRLLSLDKGLFVIKDRQAFQSEVVRLAHSEMKHPVPLDVSSLITFSGIPGPPLELCDGDPGTLSVRLWSGFPDDICLDLLSLTLIATNITDEGEGEGAKAMKSAASKMNPGWNTITLNIPPQRSGSYVLGVLTGQIGQLWFRSHSFSKGEPLDTDDFMSFEKPNRPVLKVFKPRPLVDIVAASSSPLLMNEIQWVGLIIRPIHYSLKGAILNIDPGPGLVIEMSPMIEIESHNFSCGITYTKDMEHEIKENLSIVRNEHAQLEFENGKIELPDWASNITSVLWLPVRALDNRLARGKLSDYPQKESIVDRMRTIALKLEFGSSYNQTFERTVAVHFTEPFHVSTRVANICSGTLLLQVTLHSLVKATLSIYDALLDLQAGFLPAKNRSGRPISSTFPILISPSSKGGMLFDIQLEALTERDEAKASVLDTILDIKFCISGDRYFGAHMPLAFDASSGNMLSCDTGYSVYKSVFVLRRPIPNPYLAIGFHPLPIDALRVGQLFSMRWKVERLKSYDESLQLAGKLDEILFEVKANPVNWMIAGRKCGYLSLSKKQGSRTVISIVCLPIMAGYVHPPQLYLPDVGDESIICNPAGPHLVCVLPPVLSSSFCVAS